jgi:hypothetical protein
LLKQPARVFYGWWIVAIGFILDALKEGTFSLGFATDFLSIQRELELSRTASSLAFTLGRLEGGLQGPLLGCLMIAVPHLLLARRALEDLGLLPDGASLFTVGMATDLHCA